MVRGLDGHLGEHHRHGARGAQHRLRAGRPPRRPRPDPQGLARLVLAAAALFAVVPFVSTPFLRASVEALDSVSAGAFVGSLLAVSVLIAAPILLLGMVSPYAIRLAVDSVEGAGRTAGRLYAISTVGSLAGVFAAALVLVPFVGSKRTFIVFALALAVVAVVQLKRSPALVLAPAAIAALLLVPGGTLKATGGGKVLWEKETGYQYARVIESPERDPDARAQRGPGDPLALPPRHGADRQLLGRVPRAPARRAAAPAALPGDPRQRRRHDGDGLRQVLPRHGDRRGGDRRGDHEGRPEVLRHEGAEAHDAHGRRAPLPAADGEALRRDLRRRLPPALHPVLPVARRSSSSSSATG